MRSRREMARPWDASPFFRYDFQICEVKSMQSKEKEAGPEPIEVAVLLVACRHPGLGGN